MFTEDPRAIEGSFRFLLASRALRSASIVLLNLSLSLYLKALGYSLVFIGLAYFAIVAFNVLVALALGMLGDRMGYSRTLIMAEALPLAATVGLTLSTNIYVIIASAMVGGITGSPGGLRGAFSPGMTSYIASNWPEEGERINRLSKVYAVASLSSIAGSLLLASHGFLSPIYGQVGSFRVLFGISAALTSMSFVSLLFLKERKRPMKTSRVMRRESMGYMLRVTAPNVINGAGTGLALPLLPLWFELMYRVSAGYVGMIFTAAYAFTAIGSYSSGRFLRLGRAISVSSWARVLQGILLIVMALSPFLIISAVIYSIRSFIAGVGTPVRSAISIRGISGEDYGTASGIQGVFTRASQMTSGLSGYMMEELYPLPLIAGGALQLVGAIVFYRLIRSWEVQRGFEGHEA